VYVELFHGARLSVQFIERRERPLGHRIEFRESAIDEGVIMEEKRSSLRRALRSIGRLGGILSGVRPVIWRPTDQSRLVPCPKVDPGEIADRYFRCANQGREDNRTSPRMARAACRLAGLGAGCTVNRALRVRARGVNAAARLHFWPEKATCTSRGGVESMSRAPWGDPKSETAFPFGN